MKRFVLPKLSYKRNAFLFNIFIGLSLLSIMIITILSMVMFYWMKDKSLVEINKVTRMSLQNTDTVFTSHIKRFQNYSVELYENPNIRKLMFMDHLAWDSGTQNAVNHIQNILLVNRDIMNSVYVLNDTTTILNISERFAEPDSDQDLFDIVKSHRASDSPVIWNMKDKYSGKDIQTMTFFFHKGTPSGLGGAAAVNIDMSNMAKSIFADEGTHQHQKMYIADRQGNIILHNDMSQSNRNISSEPFFTRILNSRDKYDSFTVENQEGPLTYAYLTSSNGRYFIISEMEVVHTLSEWVKTRNVILMYGLFILLIALFIAGLISYLLYKPLGHVVKTIRSSYPGESEQDRNVAELQLVSNTFTQMTNKMNSLEKENDVHAFVRLLNSKTEHTKERIENIFMKTGAIHSDHTPYAVLVVRIDGFEDFSQTGNVETISFRLDSLAAILIESLSSEVKCALFTVSEGQFICVVSEPCEGTKLDSAFLTKTAEHAQISASNMLSIDISIGISSISDDPGFVVDLYKEAFDVTKHRIVQTNRWIADAHDIRNLQSSDIPDNVAKEMLSAVAQGDYERYLSELDRIASICRGYQYVSTLRFFATLASSILRLSQDLIGEDSGQVKVNDFDIHQRVSEIYEYEKLKEWFAELFYQSSEVLREISNKKAQDFVPEALDYINQNYCDSSLSVYRVAETLNISSSYFSKIFNESIGYTFPEYVNHLRMEKAKELIQDYPELSITDISKKVGYSSNSYFTTSFKKKYGVSPSKIRSVRKN
ncbi:AraC family transcriptional regulator [Paenibacillus sp. EC2-1]|uniref:AraC family transcriptional regulator n=1 Tax=Paenibacillus sp. EC2-1 TaxID=3388665 RepID=UPI003BEEE0A8